jgi:hypothetical protein
LGFAAGTGRTQLGQRQNLQAFFLENVICPAHSGCNNGVLHLCEEQVTIIPHPTLHTEHFLGLATLDPGINNFTILWSILRPRLFLITLSVTTFDGFSNAYSI